MNREQRRRAAEELRRSRQEEADILGAQCGGHVPDIDFHRMIRDFRQQCPSAQPTQPVLPDDDVYYSLPDAAAASTSPPSASSNCNICVCVRKRPIQHHEMVQRELDCVTACNPFAIVHERKFRVDGITKCLESHQFEFDRVFDEDASTNDVYRTVAEPLVPWAIEKGGRVTVFAYGQTGSGKTHTVTGLQHLLADQIFTYIFQKRAALEGPPLEISMSFFEIYGGRPYDLLNNRQRLDTLEDARNEVQIAGLSERAAASAEEMLQLIELGNSLRTTHATAMNRDSSRSHAVCAIFLRVAGPCFAGPGLLHAKITLVDLAGSERAADSKSTIRQRRVEGAQINKSLLALKECIRAMGDPREAHVPFRASKLTLVLRDAFVSRCPSRTVMIACISPGMTSADHSVNTLRYSDRLKDHPRVVLPSRARSSEAGSSGAAPNFPLHHTSESPGPGLRNPASPSGRSPGGCQQRASSLGVMEPPNPEMSELQKSARQMPEAEQPVQAKCGNRQNLSRQGRQPGGHHLKASLGSRSQTAFAEGPDHSSAGLASPTAEQSCHGPSASASANAARTAPRNHTASSPERSSRAASCGALFQQDDRYLHNSLTSEVSERSAEMDAMAVDVGVEDLTDLEHLEVLDEVTQWEDHIISQHMVAVQEDARLLTEESGLLSQVQQGASYDIDWYVNQVDKVVRRKMDVYAGFLEDLEKFKAQLYREEALSRSHHRHSADAMWPAVGASSSLTTPPAATIVDGPAHKDRDGFQRGLPRTPRLAQTDEIDLAVLGDTISSVKDS